MDLGLKDKVVLVTGASGGIGEETARAFSREGAKVVIHYGRNREAAEVLQKELQTESLAVSADVSDEVSVANLFAQAVKKFGRVDIVVANAGIFPDTDEPIHKMDKSRWDKVIATNLTGSWLTAREFFRVLEQTKPESASLILIGSTSGVFGEYGHTEYSAAKAAVTGLVLTLKNEITRLVPKGRVNAVAPGWTWTPMTIKFKSAHDAVRKALQTRPIRKIAEPIDIANQIVVLASDAVSGQVTGRIAVVAGGMEGRILWDSEEIDPTQA